MKKLITVMLIGIFFLTGCEEDFLVKSDPVKQEVILNVTQDKINVKEETLISAKKVDESKGIIYEEPVGKGKISELVKQPIVNLNTKFAKSMNDYITVKVSEYISKIGKATDEFEPSFTYEKIDNENFISLILIMKDNPDTEQRIIYNINTETGEPVKLDELDSKYGFTGNLQNLVEQEIINGLNRTNNKEIIANSGKSLSSFWNRQFGGYPQIYARDGELYVVYDAIESDNKYQIISVVSPTKGGSNFTANELFKKAGFSDENEFAISYIGTYSDKTSLEKIMKYVEGYLSNLDYDKMPTLLMIDDNDHDKKDYLGENFYLLIPSKKYTVAKAISIDKSNGVINEDISKTLDYVMDDAFIIALPSDNSHLKANVEVSYRSNKVVFDNDNLEDLVKNNSNNLRIRLFEIPEIDGAVGYPDLVEEIAKKR